MYYLRILFLTQSTYRKILLILLTVLLAVPCTVKGELKRWLNIEVNQQAKTNNLRVACSAFVQQEKQDTKQQVEKIILPDPLADVKNKYTRLVIPLALPDFYKSQKEKIPTYLLFERFLI